MHCHLWLKKKTLHASASHKNSHLHIWHSMSHAPSLLFPSYFSSTSLSKCTPIRPSFLFPSHGDKPCDDLQNVSFSLIAEPHSPTGYEPNDLTEVDTSVLVKPMFFHRPSMTSTYDSAESISTLPPESDLGDEQIRNMLASPLYFQEREASADQIMSLSLLQEKTLRETCRSVLTQKNVDSRNVRNIFPTEKAFSQDINRFEEKTKLCSGSLIRKKHRD